MCATSPGIWHTPHSIIRLIHSCILALCANMSVSYIPVSFCIRWHLRRYRTHLVSYDHGCCTTFAWTKARPTLSALSTGALLAPRWLFAIMVAVVSVRPRGRRSLVRISGFVLKQRVPTCGRATQAGRTVNMQSACAVPLRRHKRSVTLVGNGQRICMKRYGTIRCTPWSWTRSRTLTKRSSADPCTAVYFDSEYQKRMEARGTPRGRVLSPEFGEWLMGLPAGWTQGSPAAAAKSRPRGRIAGLSLFSGCAGLDHGLSEWVRTCQYCEASVECRSVLQSLMRSGHIDSAPVAPSVERLRARQVPKVSMVVAGFPCPDVSTAGAQRGLNGQRSILFKEILRLQTMF